MRRKSRKKVNEQEEIAKFLTAEYIARKYGVKASDLLMFKTPEEMEESAGKVRSET